MKQIRQYKSYDEYIRHQSFTYINSSKRKRFLRYFDKRLRDYTARFSILNEKGYIREGQNILCLGARFGEECLSFQHYKLKTKGIDLVPTPPLVEKGDFLKLDIVNEFDLVYTNSIDHALDLDLFLKNIYIALKDNGLFFVDIFVGNKGKLEVQLFENRESIIKDCSGKFNLVEMFDDLPNYYGKKKPGILYVFKKINNGR